VRFRSHVKEPLYFGRRPDGSRYSVSYAPADDPAWEEDGLTREQAIEEDLQSGRVFVGRPSRWRHAPAALLCAFILLAGFVHVMASREGETCRTDWSAAPYAETVCE
jgi:hypothetical protein